MHHLNIFGNFSGYQGKFYPFKTASFSLFSCSLFVSQTFHEIIFIYDEAVASPFVAQHAFPSKGQKTEKQTYRAIETAVQARHRILPR